MQISWLCYLQQLFVIGAFLVLSADNLCKQFVPRSGPTERRAWSGSKLFDTLMLFLKEFFEKVIFEKNLQTTINSQHAKRFILLYNFKWICSL